MYVVEAGEDNDGKMAHPYVPYDIMADDDEADGDEHNESTRPIVNQSGKKDIETGVPSNEVCFICSNAKVMHSDDSSAAEEEAKLQGEEPVVSGALPLINPRYTGALAQSMVQP